MNNTSYFNKRLIKIVCPCSNDSFNLELTGNETEVKDLIAAILNIPIEHIKGIKDIYNNYYTFSSALQNPTLTQNYSPYYTIVLGRSHTLSDIQSNDNANFSKIEKTLNYLKENNYISKDIYKNILNIIQNERNKYNNELSILLEKTDIEKEDSIQKAIEIINTYANENNGNEGEHKSPQSNNVLYVNVLDNVEEYFEVKEDFALLKQLLTFENKNIIKTIESFEEDNDLNKFLYELNNLISKYKEKETVSNTINQNTSKDNENSSKHSSQSQKWSIYSVGNICERSELSEEVIYFVMKKLNFVEKIFFNYQRKINSNYYETFEFQKGDNEHSLSIIKQKCKEFMNNTIKFRLKNDQPKLEKLNHLIQTKNPKIQDAFNSFLNHLDKTKLSDDIYALLNSNESTNATPKIGNSVYHKSNSLNKFFGVTVVNGNSPEDKENTSQTSIHDNEATEFITVIQTMQSLTKEQKSRAVDLFNLHEPKMLKLFYSFKRNKMSLTKQSIIKAMSVLSTFTTPSNTNNKSKANVIQPLQINAQENELPIHKDKDNSLDNIIRKIPTKKKKCKLDESKINFEKLCKELNNEELLSQKEVDFLINEYNNGDEAIKSFYEVYIGSEDKEDFVESIKMYLNKRKVDDVQEEGNSGCKVLECLLNKSTFNKKQKQIINDLFKQQNGTLLSVLEVYNEDSDDAIESIELLLKKVSNGK